MTARGARALRVGLRHAVMLPDGRRLAVLRGGETPPRLLFDAGAFGIYADGANLVRALARRGVPAVSYTRAGLSGSDPAPWPPTPQRHAEDMLALLDALGQPEPVLFAGHSMAGLRLHALVRMAPERVAGLVLIDAMVPGAVRPRLLRATAAALRPVERVLPAFCRMADAYPNAMKLQGAERTDKLASVYSSAHLRAARAEIAEAANAPQPPIADAPMLVFPAGRIARCSEGLAWRENARLIDMTGYGHAGVLAAEPCERMAEVIAGWTEASRWTPLPSAPTKR